MTSTIKTEDIENKHTVALVVFYFWLDRTRRYYYGDGNNNMA